MMGITAALVLSALNGRPGGQMFEIVPKEPLKSIKPNPKSDKKIIIFEITDKIDGLRYTTIAFPTIWLKRIKGGSVVAIILAALKFISDMGLLP